MSRRGEDREGRSSIGDTSPSPGRVNPRARFLMVNGPGAESKGSELNGAMGRVKGALDGVNRRSCQFERECRLEECGFCGGRGAGNGAVLEQHCWKRYRNLYRNLYRNQEAMWSRMLCVFAVKVWTGNSEDHHPARTPKYRTVKKTETATSSSSTMAPIQRMRRAANSC